MKILMTTMSLDIGGAETHILELSRELVRRGIEVSVASNGGVYVPQLEEAGIRHYTVPLNTKNPWAVLTSYFRLRKIIRREKFDVVHAHARIPAFICGLLHRRLKFRFVTTTHGVYDAPLYWRLLSDWGEKSLAVSYDIKQYLIDNYRIPSDNITITINGIDTNRFSSQVPTEELVCELELSRSCTHRVLYVSRIDRESAHIGFQLVEAAPLLASDYEDIEFLLVGGGTAFDDLKARADEVNRILGRQVVRMVGPRTDVWRFMSLADIFVGVSRSALEAMSAELPTVIAGSQGYIGIFTPERLNAALDTNFCARGCGDSNVRLLCDDIRTLFSMSASDRVEMGRYNRRIVLDRYSISRMADDAVRVYDSVRPYRPFRHGDVLLSGYYGFGNMGDDSLLQLIIEGLRSREPDLRITVLSHTPKKTAAHFAVRSIGRFNFPAILREMKSPSCRLLISGGGTLITDITSERSLLYYTTVMKMARRHGLKTMLYASGIGPLKSGKSRKMAREALEPIESMALRDRTSVAELESLGIKADGRVRLTADPAFRLEPTADNWIKYVMNREGITRDRRYFAVSVRGGATGISEEELDKLAFVCKLIREKQKLEPLIVVLQPTMDGDISDRLAEMIRAKTVRGLCASELTSLMAFMEYAISMRLHLIIYAADAGVPAAALSRDIKLAALCETLGVPDCLVRLDDESFSSDVLLRAAERLFNEREAYAQKISARVSELRRLNADDAACAVQLIMGK